jgi:hypothetical protein
MTCTVCEISQIQYICILFTGLNIMYLMPEAGHYARNMYHVFTRLITTVVILLHITGFSGSNISSEIGYRI